MRTETDSVFRKELSAITSCPQIQAILTKPLPDPFVSPGKDNRFLCSGVRQGCDTETVIINLRAKYTGVGIRRLHMPDNLADHIGLQLIVGIQEKQPLAFSQIQCPVSGIRQSALRPFLCSQCNVRISVKKA